MLINRLLKHKQLKTKTRILVKSPLDIHVYVKSPVLLHCSLYQFKVVYTYIVRHPRNYEGINNTSFKIISYIYVIFKHTRLPGTEQKLCFCKKINKIEYRFHKTE